MDYEPKPVKMSSKTFIELAQKLLRLIDDKHTNCYKAQLMDDSEDNICGTCNGFLYVCRGGIPDVDCPSCNGTGQYLEPVFDSDEFIEFMEHTVMFGSEKFYELMNCEIDETAEGIIQPEYDEDDSDGYPF